MNPNLKQNPESIDIDALPKIQLGREVVQIEGERNLYRYFLKVEEEPASTESSDQTVS